MSSSKGVVVVVASGAVALSLVALFRMVRAQGRLIREAMARLQIAEYAALYTRGIDRLDPELIRLPFVEDGVMDIPNLPEPVSVKDFSMGATDFLKKTLVASMHNVSNVHVCFSEDFESAKSSIYFIANHFKIVGREVKNAGVYGRYCDSWVRSKKDGVFRIKYRKIIYDFQGSDWTKAIEQVGDDLLQKPQVARHENLGLRDDKNDFDYGHISFPQSQT